jgi:hypothetical protein
VPRHDHGPRRAIGSCRHGTHDLIERTERIIFHAELGQYSSHQIATFAYENGLTRSMMKRVAPAADHVATESFDSPLQNNVLDT